jgi:flagellar motor switch/type III secretory pathway protein FliN
MNDELDNLDDLLGDSPEMSLADPKLIEAAGNICNAIWNAGGEAMGVLLSRGVMYTEGQCEYNDASTIIGSELGESMICNVSWEGDREGKFSLVMPTLAAKAIVAYMMALMMGTEASPEDTALDDEGMDAFSEAISQFIGSSAQALRADIGGNIKLAVSESKVIDFSSTDITDEFGKDFVLCASGQFTIEGMNPFTVFCILDPILTGVESAITQPPSEGEEEDVDKTVNSTRETMAVNVEEPEPAGNFPKEDINNLMLPVSVTLAENKMRLESIMELVPGSIVEFKKSSEEFLDLCIEHIVIGRGEAVIVNEHFGLQIREMVNLKKAKNS